MAYRKMGENIYNIGASDRRINKFENIIPLKHGEGITYNSFLIVDEDAVILMDTLDSAVLREWMDNIDDILQGRDIDYLIIHHVEPDHCAGIVTILEKYPNVKVIGNAKSFKFLNQFYRYDAIEKGQAIVIKDGDTLETKNHKFEFILAPMVHWPEVFMTYDSANKRIFTSDAFGSFKALAGNYWVDEVDLCDWLDEMRRYYINIVGCHGLSVQKLFKKLKDLDIKEIFPLHGLCFRDEENINMIMEKYDIWSSFEPEDIGVVMVYGSMYGNSKELIEELAILIAERGIKNIQMFDASQTEPSIVMTKLFRYSHAVFSIPNYNSQIYYPMHDLLNELVNTNYQNRKYSLIVSKTWGGQAEKKAQDIFDSMKNLEKIGETFQLLSRRAPDQMDDLNALADAIADSIKEAKN